MSTWEDVNVIIKKCRRVELENCRVMSLSLKRKPSTLDVCVHTCIHIYTTSTCTYPTSRSQLQHTGLSSLTELNSGTCTWNARISRESCGKRVCGQWQLGWFALTGLTAWLNTTSGTSVAHHCGPEPTNSCVFKVTQLLWAFLHSSRLLSRHFKCSLPSPTPPYYAAATYTHFSPNLESTLKKWVDL